jgi:NADH-quinone oxidoreductase subunit I
MTSEYDFSVYEVKEHNFSFANLTAEEAAEKKKLYEQFVAEKEEMKKAVDSGQLSVDSGQLSVDSSQSSVVSQQSEVNSPEAEVPASKPAFKPSFKPKAVASPESLVAGQASELQSPEVKKPAFKPSFKAKAVSSPKSEGLTSSVQRPTSDVPTSKDNPSTK